MADYIDRQAAIDALKALEELAPTAQHVSAIFDCEDTIISFPTADVVSVVRCKDCIYLQKSFSGYYYCSRHEGCVEPKPDGFCNYGKCKEGKSNE